MKRIFLYLSGVIVAIAVMTAVSFGQVDQREFRVPAGGLIEVTNPNGQIRLTNSTDENQVLFKLIEKKSSSASLISEDKKNGLRIRVSSVLERVDLEMAAPRNATVRLKTGAGQITISGSFATVEAETDTGTIYADTEFSNLKYKLLWTHSYPRYMSDDELGPIKEKTAGKHVIEGFAEPEAETPPADEIDKPETAIAAVKSIYLRTARGIILMNVPPVEVPSNLLPKKLTKAAKAIVQSGDSILAGAIRRSAPDIFRDIEDFEPTRDRPNLNQSSKNQLVESEVKRVTVQVTDINNRAFSGLTKDDFALTERGVKREIVELKESNAPFNLVLILDVSGSVENHVDFIRKAARSFVNTVDTKDKVAIITFNDDVEKLSGFTADKDLLSESLDTFDAGGGTALYDAIGYGIVDAIRPLNGERSAIVILSDGDDNRSFLSFESLFGAIEESGALIYPMYVPSSLIASSGNYSDEPGLDPLRDRYLTNNLSSKARDEGERLAKVSGGVYFPISRLSELQKAYNDIVLQLRTAYTITFRSSESVVTGNRAAPRLRVTVKKKDAFVKLGPVTEAGN